MPLASNLLLGSSIICFLRTKRSPLVRLIFLGTVALHLALTAVWLIINNITGNGINSASIFHLYYGFLNAGAIYDRWPSLVAVTGGLFILILFIIKIIDWWLPRKLSPKFLSAAFVLVSGAFFFTP